jgi:hypothetical protein
MSQQPFGHDVASHWQTPFGLHSCPVPQAAHRLPPLPHEPDPSLLVASQVPAIVQHPCAQVFGSHPHVPLERSQRPSLHAWHVAPAVPQAVPDCDAYGTQLPTGSQQPAGQAVGSQTHRPDVVLQSCPWAQLAHAAPAAPHDVFVSDA